MHLKLSTVQERSSDSNVRLETVSVQMEFKAKRLHVVTERVSSKRHETRSKGCVLGYKKHLESGR